MTEGHSTLLLVPRSGEVVLARALRELACYGLERLQ